MTVFVPAPAALPVAPGEDGRWIEARLHFAEAGGRTVLARQHAPYPFHITRPFRLDPQRPGLATLYLQSAAGGLYRADRLALDLAAAAGAAAHVTTQSATVVHDTRGVAVRQDTTVRVASGAFLAYTPDPAILFPGAAYESATEAVIERGARAILADSFCRHDPTRTGRVFERFSVSTLVRDAEGSVLVADRGAIPGQDFAGPASPLGAYGASGTVFILAPGQDFSALAPAIEQALAPLGCLAGASPLPAAAGLGVRLLAADGGALARGIERVFALGFEALLGVAPARRRK